MGLRVFSLRRQGLLRSLPRNSTKSLKISRGPPYQVRGKLSFPGDFKFSGVLNLGVVGQFGERKYWGNKNFCATPLTKWQS